MPSRIFKVTKLGPRNMWQQYSGWLISIPIIAGVILAGIYMLLPEQQLKWFLLTLIIATVILFLIGTSIFYISKILSEKLLGKEHHHVDIIFAGTIILALSQLFGPLFGASYPLILGPEACDYSLSFSSMYYNVTYDYATDNYTFTSTDISGQHYGPMKDNHYQKGERIFIHTNILADNLNPLMKYEVQIFLDLKPPKNVTASVARPVIKVDQSSDVLISLDNPDPGTYPIKVQGVGADGKVREAMTVIGVSSKIGSRLYTPSGPHYDEAIKAYDEAIKAYDEATGIDHQYANAWYKKGQALEALGRTADADAAKAKAKELGYKG